MAYPSSALGVRIRIAPGADRTADPDTYPWQDISADVLWSQPISTVRGAQDEQPESNSDLRFTLRNTVSKAVAGLASRYTSDNALSDLWPYFVEGLPVELAYDLGDGSGYVVDMRQYLAAAVMDWPGRSGRFCTVQVACAGLLREIGKSKDTASAGRRTHVGYSATHPTPLGYWPMEDGRDAAVFGSGLPGGSQLQIASPDGTPIAMSTDDTLPGSGPLPVFTSAGEFTLPAVPASATTWTVQHAFRGAGTSYSVIRIDTTDLIVTVSISSGTNQWTVAVTNQAGATVASTTKTLSAAQTAGPWISVATQMIDQPDVISDQAKVYLLDTATGAVIDSITHNVGTNRYHTPTTASINVAAGEASYGHLAVYADATLALLQRNAQACGGWADETAGRRIERVCGEVRIPFSSIGDLDATPRMGPQPTGRTLDVLRDAEQVGRGQVDDSKGMLLYRTLGSLYNQAAAVTLDVDQRTLIMPLNPITDDSRTVTRWTIQRSNGASATVQDDELIEQMGGRPIEDGRTINLADDTQPGIYAGHLLTLTTVQGQRYANVTVDLRLCPDATRTQLQAMRLGDRVTIVNPPPQLPAADIDLLFVGWSTVNQGRRGRWQLVANCVPHAPYAVGVVGNGSGTAGSWAQLSAGTQLSAELASGATVLTVSIPAQKPLLTTDAALLAAHPASLIVGGEVMPIAAVTGAASPQQVTVTRSLAKMHPAGTPVRIYRPLVAIY